MPQFAAKLAHGASRVSHRVQPRASIRRVFVVAGPVNGLPFGAWVFPGDVLHTVEVQITSAEFGGTTYSDQVISFTQSGCSELCVARNGWLVC